MQDLPSAASAAELSALLGPLRRRVLRRSRDLAGLPDLPEAQVEVLRALAERGPLTPSRLADTLLLARPTISNLLRATGTAGLTRRTAATDDLRGVVVSATPAALDLLERYDRASASTLSAAIERLGPGDREALPGAVEVLDRLLAALGDGEHRSGG